MLYPVKAIIAKRPRKDGKNAINFQYCYSATRRVTVDPEVAIPAAYWNKKRQIISKNLPSEFGDSKVLNDNLSRMRKVIEALIDKGQSIDVPCLGKYVKGLFTPDLKIADVPNEVPIQLVPQKLDFFDHLDDYITFKEKKVVSPGSIRCLRDRLKAFQVIMSIHKNSAEGILRSITTTAFVGFIYSGLSSAHELYTSSYFLMLLLNTSQACQMFIIQHFG
jgi:hypothetical protein